MDHQLSAEEIQAIKDGRAFLIDVRSDGELAEKSCKFAQHWDVDQMVEGRFPHLPKDKPVYVFCRVGNRSGLAQRLMSAQGFTDVHDIGGLTSVPDELCG